MTRLIESGNSLVIPSRFISGGKMIGAKLMKKAVKLFLGTHNFNAFRSSSCGAKSPIRTIEKSTITQKGDKISIIFSSRSFLQQQVRSMVGCIKLIGEGKWNSNNLKSLLKSKILQKDGTVTW